MTTQARLTELHDHLFHQLGDELLRRLEPRYRALRSHGLNERGESIVGQPDSYVGPSAHACTIAVCYTVQRQGWWRKLAKDVEEVRRSCPSVLEIVAVVARDVDREGPRRAGKSADQDWLRLVQHAAGEAALRIIDRKELAAYLDSEHQDLRFRFLGLPYSRLTAVGIVCSAQRATRQTLEAISMSGRFERSRYITRSADRDLYRRWQASFDNRVGEASHSKPRARLIPLVTDSGLGKTSLVCSFAESLMPVLPVLLLQARDIAFTAEDAVARHVIQRLQGVIDPGALVIEESAILRHLVGGIPFTLILDGLDEVHAPEAVRRALGFWLTSQLGAASTLIATSRPEFWRVCADPAWQGYVAEIARAPTDLLSEGAARPREFAGAIRSPERFTGEELERAWTVAGHARDDLYALPEGSRLELMHPFTLRAFIDIAADSAHDFRIINRTALLEAWLMRRLDAEIDPSKRITRELLLQALRTLAAAAAKTPGGTLCVDEITGVPRFDPAAPPGPVVECLLAANLLESLPDRVNRVRFTMEAVQDFCEAQSVVDEIRRAPLEVAERFAAMRFTDAAPKLDHLRPLLTGTVCERTFLGKLIERDAVMSGAALQDRNDQWAQELRTSIASALAEELGARHVMRRAFVIEMLARLGAEGIQILVDCVVSAPKAHPALKRLAALALHKVGCAAAATFIYRWGPYWVDKDLDAHYFPETLALARRGDQELKEALTARAQEQLSASSGTSAHAYAVAVLAHLQEDALAEHLDERLAANGRLRRYENHALIALGSTEAARVFLTCATAVTKALDAMGDRNDADRDSFYYSIHIHSADIKHLLNEPFIHVLRKLLHSESRSAAYLGLDLAIRAGASALLRDVAQTQARLQVLGGLEFPQSAVDPATWLQAWSSRDEDRTRARLLRAFPAYPSIAVEEVLMRCLGNPQLQNGAARALEHYGSLRALPELREVLRNAKDYEQPLSLTHVVLAIGSLRDEISVPVLKTLAFEPESPLRSVAIRSLGDIGTEDAEQALVNIFQAGISVFRAGAALILCGRPTAVSAVLDYVRQQPDGPKVLCKILNGLTSYRGWKAGEYYRHVQDGPIATCIAEYQPSSQDEHWERIHAIERIDGPAIRQLLRTLLRKAGTPDDAFLREDGKYLVSTNCRRDLALRGDEFAIPYVLDSELQKTEVFLSLLSDALQRFPRSAVAAELKRRLSTSEGASSTKYLIALLGRYGSAEDGVLLDGHSASDDAAIADAAYEARMRLIDPLRVPERWNSI